MIYLYADGAARPTNPGPAGIGAVGYNADGEMVIEISEHIGNATNNVAEYKAVLAGLKAAIDLGETSVRVHTDSQLVVRHFKNVYKCKTDTLVPLLSRLRGLSKRFTLFEIKWIPREQNRYADGLSVAGAYPPGVAHE